VRATGSKSFLVLFSKKNTASFSEEKEAKRLLSLRSFTLRRNCVRQLQLHQEQKSFCFFFFRKRRILSHPKG
jgi:hypothetical protein